MFEEDKNRKRGERRYQAALHKRYALREIARLLAKNAAHDLLYPNGKQDAGCSERSIAAMFLRDGGKRVRPWCWEYDWNVSGRSWKTQIARMDLELEEFNEDPESFFSLYGHDDLDSILDDRSNSDEFIPNHDPGEESVLTCGGLRQEVP